MKLIPKAHRNGDAEPGSASDDTKADFPKSDGKSIPGEDTDKQGGSIPHPLTKALQQHNNHKNRKTDQQVARRSIVLTPYTTRKVIDADRQQVNPDGDQNRADHKRREEPLQRLEEDGHNHLYQSA